MVGFWGLNFTSSLGLLVAVTLELPGLLWGGGVGGVEVSGMPGGYHLLRFIF